MPDLDEDDIPTAKMCQECKGEGYITHESDRYHSHQRCRWCKGSGRVPVSTQFPKVNP